MRRAWRMALACVVAAGCTDSPSRPGDGGGRSGCAAATVHAPAHPFTAEALARRRAILMESIGSGVVVLPAGWDRPWDPANAAGRQEANFYYLTGLDTPGMWLVLVARQDGPDEEILYVGAGAAGSPSVAAHAVTGIDDVRCLDAAAAQVDALLAELDVDTLWTSALHGELGQAVDLSGIVLRPLRPDFRGYRSLKEPVEIERLRRAARISSAGLLAGMARVGPDVAEADVRAAIEQVFADSGAARTAFPSIVASGENVFELHYFDAADTMRAGDYVVIDVGAEYARYAGDVARSLPVSGTFTAREREVYEVLLEARQAVLDALAIGQSPFVAEQAKFDVYVNRWETCGEWCYNFEWHGLYHAVGLDVHDGEYFEIAHVPGVVVNVEPGLYLAAEGFGFRIEDTIVLTAAGYELLTTGLPTTVEEIEAFMAAH